MGGEGNKWSFFWGLVLLLLIMVSFLLVGSLIRGIVTVISVHPAQWCTSPLGVVPAGLGDGIGHCLDVAKLQRVGLFISLVFLGGLLFTLFLRVWVFSFPLDMLVALREPTPCYHDAYSVGIPKRGIWEEERAKSA